MDIITKTLYIQIDETPMPEMHPELAKLVPTVDCRLLNDFYSIFGNALCGDLTASDGRKLYRIIKPAGRILAEYAASDGSAEAMADLRKQWYDLLVIIFEGYGYHQDSFTFTLPTHFLKWLERNPTNDYYPLLASRTQITIYIAGDIALDLLSKAEKIILPTIKDICWCIPSNPNMQIFSLLSALTYYKKVRPYISWQHSIGEEMHYLDNPAIFNIDGVILGHTTSNEIKSIIDNNYLKETLCGFDYNGFDFSTYNNKSIVSGILTNLSFGHHCKRLANNTLLCIITHNAIVSGNYIEFPYIIDSVSYNDLYLHLLLLGFLLKEKPHIDGYTAFSASFQRETDEYLIKIQFYESLESNLTDRLEAGKDQPGTIQRIEVWLKNH